MPRKHLASLARENEQALKQRYAEHLASHPDSNTIVELYATCEPIWTVCISSHADAVYHFLKEGEYYNKYHWEHKNGAPVFLVPEKVEPDETTVDWSTFGPHLQRNPRDKEYAPRREVFNRFARNEEHFAYGSYFIGQKGATGFGGFQMRFRRESVLTIDGLSFLQQDSLSYCRAIDGAQDQGWEVDAETLLANLASCNSVTELMCLKMKNDDLAEGLSCCLGKICVPETYEYLEAQFEAGYDLACIEGIDRPQVKDDQRKIMARFSMLDPNQLDDGKLSPDERVVKYYLLASAEIDDKFSPFQ